VGELDLEMAHNLEQLAPFGNGNPPVVLASEGLRLTNSSTFGRQQEHLRLRWKTRAA